MIVHVAKCIIAFFVISPPLCVCVFVCVASAALILFLVILGVWCLVYNASCCCSGKKHDMMRVS